MPYIYNSIRYFIVLGFVFIFSCKKDSDIAGPAIEIYAPNQNQSFNVLDVIWVSGRINDASKITSVAISLLNEQQKVVHVGVPVPVTSPSMDFNVQYPLDNINLESGTYYLTVTASDGENENRKYQKIYLIAVPKILKKTFVVTQTNSSQTNWGYIDSTFSNIVPFTTFSGDYLGSSVSNYYQQLFNCNNYNGNYSSFDLTTNALKYTISGNVSINPCFTGYTVSTKNTYVARFDEFIKGYNFKGQPIFNAQTIDGYYARQLIMNNGVLIAEQKNKITASKILVSYYQTGSPDVQTNLTQDVVIMQEKDHSNVFVFGNVSGQGVIQLYDRINNNLWNPYPSSLPLGSVLSAIKIDENTYLIGHSNGTIYKYQYQISSLTSYVSGFTAKLLKYDFESNKLYVIENNKITVLDYLTVTPLNSITSGQTILDVHLLYNR